MNVRHLKIWLSSIIVLIFAIIIIGGITRLTGSGLSMVDWRPVMGIFPPITDAQWQDVFNQYKAFPEYQLRNKGMSLDAFKFIFFWEYLHRILGRLIGLSIIIPFLYFYFKKKLSKSLIYKSLIMTSLVIIQGVIGWYMVKSGLSNTPQVSHFRLALHLSLALVLLQFCVWTLLSILSKKTKPHRLYIPMKLWVAGLGLQIIYGAFTAGLHAGWGYNTYPKMEGEWLPEAAWMLLPALKNIAYNPVMIQFIHRHLGVLLLLGFVYIFWSINRNKATQMQGWSSQLVLLLLSLQIGAGIATLIFKVPLGLAVVHQFLGSVLLTVSIVLTHSLSHTYAHEKTK